MSDIARFDAWLADDGPAALVIREPLEPIEGADGVLFPATYAAAEEKSKFPGGYNIDTFPDGSNVCLVDSVGSQANRIEPIFGDPEYAGLVPQVVIRAGDEPIQLLKAGHRAGDAVVRCSALKGEFQVAFKAVLKGNAEPLAKVAPTSLVFGVWDSRGTQAKLPRLVSSTIRAFNVKQLHRSAQFVPATEFVERKLLDQPDDKKTADQYAERGFVHVPASWSHGGVTAASVRRDASLSLAALHLLAVREANGSLSTDRTQVLRRYVLGLALVALTWAPKKGWYLRQGCTLVGAEGQRRLFQVVNGDGTRTDATLTHKDAVAYARAAAAAFGTGPDREVEYDKKLAERDIKGEAAEGEQVKGEVVSVDAAAGKFTLKKGKERVEVTTGDGTAYLKGDADSTFTVVVVPKAKVEVELADGVATKVSAK